MYRLGLLALTVIVTPALLLAQTSERVDFRAPLSPSSEVAPVTGREAVGEANVAMHLRRDSAGAVMSALVDFDVEFYVGQEEELIALHIHRGGAGANGPIVISSGGLDFGTPSVPVPEPGSGRIWRQRNVAITDAGELTAINGVLANPGGYYVNLHSNSHRGGLLRGQLQRTVSAKTDTLDTLLRRLFFLLGFRP